MHLIPDLMLRRARGRHAAAVRRGHLLPVAASRPAEPEPPVRRPRRRLDAPQDAAFYSCGCGYGWTGAVTTSVGCPHCGSAQAW